jgi:signal transduction histidine kinase
MVLTRRMRPWLLAGIAGLLALIIWIDLVTGYEFELFVFYFVPVGLAAWFLGRAAGMGFALASAVGWYVADRLALHPYSNGLFLYWETFMRLLSYFTTALTLSAIRRGVQEREDLLHVVAHDMRAPLGAVTGQAQLLRRHPGADPWSVARADAILRASGRMVSMIEELVDGARLDAGRLRLDLERVELHAYLGELLARMEPSLEVERVDVPPPGPEPMVVRADPRRLERVLVNLLSNALKYAPGSRVRVELASAAGWVDISIVDGGPGIHPEDLPRLFHRFERGRGNGSRDGLGLGLYGARRLVEAHGGSIEVESRPGGGSRFRVRLPAGS